MKHKQILYITYNNRQRILKAETNQLCKKSRKLKCFIKKNKKNYLLLEPFCSEFTSLEELSISKTCLSAESQAEILLNLANLAVLPR